jgi:NAD(P)-dependent dehydrogenase (short-subunit alcohol dehydrogenase family)
MISGANRGIGLSIARELKQAGLTLSLGIRRPGDFSDPLAADAEVLIHGYHVTDLPRDQITDPADLAKLVATVVALPNTAAVAELLVNCRYEHML